MGQHLPALVTILNTLLLFFAGLRVAMARNKYGIKVPATTGNEDFERVFRAHMNTLEWTSVILPSMWVFAHYFSPGWAGVVGLVWIASRVVYVLAYAHSAKAREIPFMVGVLCFAIFALGSLGFIVRGLIS